MITRDEFLGRHRPDLLAAREAIREATEPVVQALGAHASLDGAVFFARDNYYGDTASTVESINRSIHDDARYSFQREKISGRRVDLYSSAVGETFGSGVQQYAQSRMNPDQHTVYGVPLGDNSVDGVLQFAFSKEYGELPDEADIVSVIDMHRKNLGIAANKYFAAGSHYDSMADALLLDTPTTPNAYMVEWDLDGSTRSRQTSYPMLRDYLNHAAQAYRDIFTAVGGERMKANGDGETYRIELPYPGIDRNNLQQIGVFGQAVVKSVIADLLTTHNAIAKNYDGAIGPMRVITELGHFEQTKMGESSPSMWDLSEVAKQAARGQDTIAFGRQARAALDAAQ